MTVWFIGYLIVLGGIMDEDDEDFKWWYYISLMVIWPLVLGGVINTIFEHCKDD